MIISDETLFVIDILMVILFIGLIIAIKKEKKKSIINIRRMRTLKILAFVTAIIALVIFIDIFINNFTMTELMRWGES